jgi:hypothetical protein
MVYCLFSPSKAALFSTLQDTECIQRDQDLFYLVLSDIYPPYQSSKELIRKIWAAYNGLLYSIMGFCWKAKFLVIHPASTQNPTMFKNKCLGGMLWLGSKLTCYECSQVRINSIPDMMISEISNWILNGENATNGTYFNSQKEVLLFQNSWIFPDINLSNQEI